jgi:hypothetical protein
MPPGSGFKDAQRTDPLDGLEQLRRRREMSDCLHCDIIELVQKRIEGGGADIAELASMIVESLAEVVLLAPEDEQAKLMADAFAHFGHMFLEKSGAMEGSGSTH